MDAHPIANIAAIPQASMPILQKILLNESVMQHHTEVLA